MVPLPTAHPVGPSFSPTGLLCIHSVCVAASERRRGVATRLLRAYLGFAPATTPQLREVRLICKAALMPLYGGVGFQLVGPSEVEHGRDPWLEMRLPLLDAGGAAAADGSGDVVAAGERGTAGKAEGEEGGGGSLRQQQQQEEKAAAAVPASRWEGQQRPE